MDVGKKKDFQVCTVLKVFLFNTISQSAGPALSEILLRYQCGRPYVRYIVSVLMYGIKPVQGQINLIACFKAVRQMDIIGIVAVKAQAKLRIVLLQPALSVRFIDDLLIADFRHGGKDIRVPLH